MQYRNLLFLLATSLFLLSAPQASGQFIKKLAKSAQRAAERTVENRVNREASKKTDQVLDSILEPGKGQYPNSDSNSINSKNSGNSATETVNDPMGQKQHLPPINLKFTASLILFAEKIRCSSMILMPILLETSHPNGILTEMGRSYPLGDLEINGLNSKAVVCTSLKFRSCRQNTP
jgi:hypothetical protein